ncbi:MAG: hypothetical protein HKM93_01540 [Desulfobacteraceae bacterium]|nr:hypothetical protein [Desulfobacteraceae bacterium]
MIKKHILTLAVAILAAGLTNCSGLKQPAKTIDYYVLEYPPPPSAEDIDIQLPFSLYIKRFSAAPYYTGNPIRFREMPYKMASYHYHKWVVPPAEMAASLLIRDFKATLPPTFVVSPDDTMGPTHSLWAHIEDFYEDDTGDPWQAVFTVHVIFSDERKTDITDRIVFQKWYKQVKACDGKHPRALAKAMSEAMSDISAQIIDDVISVAGKAGL